MNDVKLQEGLQPIDKHLRPIKIGDEISALEISTEDVRVSGDMFLGGSVTTETINSDSDITLNAVNDVNIPVNVGLTFGDDGEKIEGDGTNLTISSSRGLTLDIDGEMFFDSALGIFNFYDDGDSDDAFKITVAGGTGATTLETVSDAADGHLTLDPDGDLLVSGADVKMDSSKKLYLDGGGDTYILESGADNLAIVVGGVQFVNATEGLNGRMDWKFRDAVVGFDINTASFNATDTDVDFRAGNKCKLTLTADITDVHFIFPNMSGNFVCLFIQDGTGGWDVSNWKTKDSAGNAGAGNSGVVLWAGGSATSLTETAGKTDIVSLFWDASTETAYAVASENF